MIVVEQHIGITKLLVFDVEDIVVDRKVGLGVIVAGIAVIDVIALVGDLFNHDVVIGKLPGITVNVLCVP